MSVKSRISVVLFVVIAIVAYVFKVHPDFIIVMLPQYVDAYLVQAMYPRDRKNMGATRVPLVSKLIPQNLTKDDIRDIIKNSKEGYPVLVRNFLNVDRDEAVTKLKAANKGKDIRLLDYQNWTTHHFSISCSGNKISPTAMPFDEYAQNFLLGESSKNHTFYYAGFEAITDAKAIEDVTGIDWTELGDYRQNNMFVSNFPYDITTAPLHCAPIDSVSVQLFGTKTWYFISPEEWTTVPNIPMPTCFSLPITDDELVAKFKHVIAIKQGPGDLIYFGPHWCHAVTTSSGPNLMFNLRFNAEEKIKNGPWSLLFKLMVRKFLRPFKMGVPHDNIKRYPIIYQDLNRYFDDCGKSEAFEKLVKQFTDIN